MIIVTGLLGRCGARRKCHSAKSENESFTHYQSPSPLLRADACCVQTLKQACEEIVRWGAIYEMANKLSCQLMSGPLIVSVKRRMLGEQNRGRLPSPSIDKGGGKRRGKGHLGIHCADGNN